MKRLYTTLISGLLFVAPAMYAQEFGKPEDPKNLQIKFDPKTNKAVFTWDAPKVDANGNKLGKENLIYNVYNSKGISIGIVNEPKFERVECTSEFPTNITYAVRAGAAKDPTQTSTVVSGNVIKTDVALLRPVSKLPIQESFAQTDDITIFDIEQYFNGNEQEVGGNLVKVCNDKSYTGCSSQDGDNGFVAFMLNKGSFYEVKMISTFVDLSDTTDPVLVFYVLNRGIVSSGALWNGTVCVDVQEEGTDNWVTINKWSDPTETQQWKEVETSLKAYKGKIVRLQIRGMMGGAVVSHMMDNFRVFDKVANNLAVSDLRVPKYVNRGSDGEFRVRVHNVGQKAVSKYKVSLYCNGKVVQTVDGPALDRYRTGLVKFTAATTAAQPSESQYYVKLEYDDDIDHDNVTESKTVTLVEPNRPFPTALAAKNEKAGVALSWNAPDLSAPKVKAVTESFEGLDLFEYRESGFGAWNVYDEDGQYTALVTLSDGAYPTHLIPKAYTVFSDEVHGYGDASAFTGHKYLLSTPTMSTTKTKSDWLISPALSGEAQTISFYVKSIVAKKAENFTVMYSTGSNNPSDFKDLEAAHSVNVASWTMQEAKLPAGTKYFAIKATVKMPQSALAIDNITYVPEVIESGLKLTGYNIYRDGEKINKDVVATAIYLDTDATSGEHVYSVSAVYNNGESRASDSVRVSGSSSVESVEVVNTVVATEAYNLSGIAVDPANLQPGQIYVEKVHYDDGTYRVTKRVAK